MQATAAPRGPGNWPAVADYLAIISRPLQAPTDVEIAIRILIFFTDPKPLQWMQ